MTPTLVLVRYLAYNLLALTVPAVGLIDMWFFFRQAMQEYPIIIKLDQSILITEQFTDIVVAENNPISGGDTV